MSDSELTGFSSSESGTSSSCVSVLNHSLRGVQNNDPERSQGLTRPPDGWEPAPEDEVDLALKVRSGAVH